MLEKVYALVDCNSYYVSCERLFNASLRNIPIVILSNNDGCVVSLSKEAKLLGIKRGSPYFKIEKILNKHGGKAFSSNYTLYGDMSARVMKTLASMVPGIEIYSIDEAFLDLTGLEHHDLSAFCHEIKMRIEKEVGIPVSLGCARTKVLSKVANRLAKKSQKANGVLNLVDSPYLDLALERTPIEEVWGIGRKSAEKLIFQGIRSAYDFREYQNDRMIQKLLTKLGRQIQEELREVHCFNLEEGVESKKQIISSKSFGRPILLKSEMKEAIANYVSRASEKLRRQKSVCFQVGLWLTTNPFSNTPQYHNQVFMPLTTGSQDTLFLIDCAFSLLDHIFEEGFSYKKAGIILSDLRDERENQLSLFGPILDPKRERLMKEIDRINLLYGSETIKSLACGLDPMWKMLCEKKSKNFTTRWSDIIKAR